MSWMFDRLCEIAVADQVDVTLCADVDPSLLRGDTADLAEVLLRAAAVPQLEVMALSSETPAHATPARPLHVMDLAELATAGAIDALGEAFARQRLVPGTAVRLRGSELSVVELGAEREAASTPGRRTVLATDAAGRSADLHRIGGDGLGIAIGGVDPEAQVRVDTFLGVVSILDALVTLRSFAFGCDSIRPGPAGRREVPRPTPALRLVV